MAQPGDTVHVLPGTYAGDIATKNNGAASAHVKFVSDSKWGATIVAGSTDTLWWSKGAY
jgi:hypothetical protein